MRCILIFFFTLLTVFLHAQNRGSTEGFYEDYSEEQEDNFIDPDSVDYESYTKKTSSFKALFNGEPGRAIMYGMLIPGGGQMYNKKYWKFPIALAAESAGITTFIIARQRYRTVDQLYALAIEEPESVTFTVQQLGEFRSRYRKASEQAGIAMIAVHILIAVESYIDRHLTNFDIDEDLSFQIKNLNQPYSAPVANFGITYNLYKDKETQTLHEVW